MSSITPEYVKALLHEIAVRSNLEDWNYKVIDFECKAQNFFGALIPVSLTGRRNDNDTTVKLDLVLKLAPTDVRYRLSGALTLFFRRECFMYDFAFEEYKKLMLNIPSSVYIFPKCYFTRNRELEEVIAMEDMREEGYKPYIHSQFLDIQHLQLVLKALANFHALSFIMKYQNPELYQLVAKECPPINEQTNKRFIDILKDRLLKAIEKFANTYYEAILTELFKSCDKFIGMVAESVSNTCVVHGDMWKENVLFKYDENNKPVSACVIDYQTCRVNSPAYDVMFLMMSSSDSKLRSAHQQTLLQLYHETLAQLLTEAGVHVTQVYSKEMFISDCEVVSPACTIVANTALWLASGLQQEGHVRSKQVITSETEMTEAITRYKELIQGILSDNQWLNDMIKR